MIYHDYRIHLHDMLAIMAKNVTALRLQRIIRYVRRPEWLNPEKRGLTGAVIDIGTDPIFEMSELFYTSILNQYSAHNISSVHKLCIKFSTTSIISSKYLYT